MSFEFLQKLKPGDKVIYVTDIVSSIATVERVTKTMIIVNGMRFRRSNGSAIKKPPFSIAHLAEATEERMEQVRRANCKTRLAAFFKDFNYRSLSLETLELLYKTLKDAEQDNVI